MEHKDMGRPSYTYNGAAKRLNKSVRSIYDYVKKGYIKKEYHNGKEVRLNGEDVEQLSEELDSNMPTLTRKNFLLLQNRVFKLEEVMAAVKVILQIENDPIRLTGNDLLLLHHKAIEALNLKEKSIKEVNFWSEVFIKFDEITLENLNAVINSSQPWKIFYQLCLDLIQYCEAKLNEPSILIKLEQGRKNLRSISLMWVELTKGSIPSSVFSDLDTKKERIIKKLLIEKQK